MKKFRNKADFLNTSDKNLLTYLTDILIILLTNELLCMRTH